MNRIRFLNPRADKWFVGAVEVAVALGVTGPEELQTRLRQTYPIAVVREGRLAGDAWPVWYVYRDGRWTDDAEA